MLEIILVFSGAFIEELFDSDNISIFFFKFSDPFFDEDKKSTASEESIDGEVTSFPFFSLINPFLTFGAIR